MYKLSDIWFLFYPLLMQPETLIPIYDHICLTLTYCDSACMAHLICGLFLTENSGAGNFPA